MKKVNKLKRLNHIMKHKVKVIHLANGNEILTKHLKIYAEQNGITI